MLAPQKHTFKQKPIKMYAFMKINHQAPIITKREIIIQASPTVVWTVHTAINEWSQWHPSIDMSKLEGPIAVGSIFQWKSGGLNITSTIQVVEPHQRIGWIGKTLGARSRHIWILQPHDNGTILKTEESMDGWLISILKLVSPKFLEKSLDTWLQSLKIRVEDSCREG